MAVPFVAAILLAMRLDSGPIRTAADATRPGFVLRDATAEAGIRFVHKRPSFDPKIAGVEPHVAALGSRLASPEPQEALARRSAQSLVLLLQARLLRERAPAVVADAFIASRFDNAHGRIYGTLPDTSTLPAIIDRAWPM